LLEDGCLTAISIEKLLSSSGAYFIVIISVDNCGKDVGG